MYVCMYVCMYMYVFKDAVWFPQLHNWLIPLIDWSAMLFLTEMYAERGHQVEAISTK